MNNHRQRSFISKEVLLVTLWLFSWPGAIFAVQGDLLWGMVYNPSVSFDGAVDVKTDSTGIYVTGTDSTTGDTRWRTQKRAIADASIILWDKPINPTVNRDFPSGLAVDSTGVYIGGTIDNVPTAAGGGDTKMRIEKRSLVNGDPIWTQIVDSGSGSNTLSGLAVDTTGLYVSSGERPTSGGDSRGRIEKRSLVTGEPIWVEWSNPSPYGDGLTSVTVDATGVYVAGCDSMNATSVGAQDRQWRIEKRSLVTGDLVWEQVNDPNPNGNDCAYSIEAFDDILYVGGFDTTQGGAAVWRVERRSAYDGVVEWVYQKPPTSLGWWEYLWDVAADSTGAYLVGYDRAGSPSFSDIPRIQKLNASDGSLAWTRASQTGLSITLDSTGIYSVGEVDVGSSFVTTNTQWSIEKSEKGLLAPTASIVNPATNITVVDGSTISFFGIGTDPDGTIGAYEWRDGECATGTLLSDTDSFTKNDFIAGVHTVYFRVQDNDGVWSSCDSVTITSTSPVATINVTPNPIDYGSSVVVTWTSNASSCTASSGSSGWAGPRGGSGSWTSGSLTASVTYAITCNGASDSESVVVQSVCGDGVVSGSEQCDGAGGQCTALGGYAGGTYSCYPAGSPNECTIDASACSSPATQCSDGIDNDGDGYTDFDGNGTPANADPGCTSATDTSEFNIGSIRPR